MAKTYTMTGWRVGWMIAPPDVSAAAASLQSHATPTWPTSQRAALAARCRAASTTWCAVPGEAFGTPGYARLSFALGDDDLEEGMATLAKLLG